jgi:ABC-type transporter Mla MlaB component
MHRVTVFGVNPVTHGPRLAALSPQMSFKAEVVDDEGRITLRLAGRLDREQSPELLNLYHETRVAVRLDLTDLLSADAAGLDALRTLRSRGAGLVGLSPYLGLQLEAEPPGHTPK